jgi:hypothetical protein
MPKKIDAAVNSGTPPSTANVTIVSPETMTRITPITMWWMWTPPPPEMLRGCHHLRGLSLSAWLRMYRTMVRVTKNVRMNAIRHHMSGNRDGGTARDKSQWRSRFGCTQKTYAGLRVSSPGYPTTRRSAPIVWSPT